eukprot:TRINITY_DN1670_c0_g1_i2.p1 TRINITY_DN1670_c0_g1~~TRINITY_DN1670_c0_g1_i2.p1  ORF type:complete len:120 (-),score=29.15 TRINITY_DN1670_c0_g1_i2:37-396(-)
MLRAKALPDLLKQANTTGIKGTLLLQEDGSMLAATGIDNEERQQIIAAIVSNIWKSYQKEHQSELEFMMIDNEQGKVVATRVSKLILVIYGDDDSQYGMLKAKAQLLRDYLEKPLSEVF